MYMGQMAIISKLKFDKAKQINKKLLLQLDIIIFPHQERSFMNMDIEEANKTIEAELEKRLHRGSIPGNLKYFADKFSDGKVQINYADDIQNMFLAIYEYKEVFQTNIGKLPK